MRKLIVEVASKEGTRIERVTLNEKGVSIGRAWNSDLIIQDKFVDPDHLRLSLNQEQQIEVTELATTNGARLAGKHLKGGSNPYRLGDLLTIGDTRLKIFDSEIAVAAASLRSKWFLMAQRFSGLKALAVLTMLALCVQGVQAYSASTEPLKAESIAVAAFGVLMLLLIWSLVFGFVAKLIRGESNFKPLWILACFTVIIANTLTMLLLVVRFNLQNVEVGEALSVVVFGVFLIWLLVGVFSYTTHFQSKAKWLCSSLVALSFYGLSQSDDYLKEAHQRWSSSTVTEQSTLPPFFLISEAVSIDEYLKETESLFDTQ
jgi:hypothetical protein